MIQADRIKARAQEDDLGRSGITKAIAKRLGISAPAEDELVRDMLNLKKDQIALAYEIPYYDLAGKKIKFSRWKIMWGDDEEHNLKYYQEPNTLPRPYLPPLIDWIKVAADPKQRLIITEGEKKAACACVNRLPCIGLGGVWSFKSKRHSLRMLKEFDEIEWTEREVEVCYDNDMYENPDVAHALGTLAAELRSRGAKVFVRRLPAGPDKLGLDDFLMQYGVKKYLALECDEEGGSRELHEFNEQLIYIEEQKGYHEIETSIMYRNRDELVRKFGYKKIIGDSGKPVRAIDHWVEWENRRAARRLTFEPGRPESVDGAFNMWKAHTLGPRKGDIAQFLELIRSLEDSAWLIKWLAFPLQRPGTKLFTSVLVWSHMHGTGKSFIGKVMRYIYGRTSGMITSAQLNGNFNGWAKNKQFIVGEEVSDYGGKSDTHALKILITEPTMTINQKYVEPYEIPNYTNFYFTSNEPAPFKIEDADRRFFVVSMDDKKSESYWRSLDKWADWEGDQSGIAAWYWYLMNRVDVSGFNPRSAAPITGEKLRVIATARTEVEQWCHDLLDAPDSAVGNIVGARLNAKQDVFTIDMMRAWYDPNGDKREKALSSQLGRALRKAGAASPSSPVRCKDGKKRRLVAIRNLDFWRKNTDDHTRWANNFALGDPMKRVKS